jgi:hypothetical protein
MGIDLHLSTCVDTQSPKYLEMAQGHISLSGTALLDNLFGAFDHQLKAHKLSYNLLGRR